MSDAPALPAALLPALPLVGNELVRVRQASGWVYATAAQIAALVAIGPLSDEIGALQTGLAALQSSVATLAQIASANAAIVTLAQRVAALEGKPDPCVALAGTLPLATVQIGTTILQVAVPGLLATDRVVVEPGADLPAGLGLAWAHPVAAGLLAVAVESLAVVTLKSSVPLAVTALR